MITKRKRNAPDLTLRNLRATEKRLKRIEETLATLIIFLIPGFGEDDARELLRMLRGKK